MVNSSDAEPEVPSAAVLREQLVTALKQRGHVRSAPVEQAFCRVPREQFLPGVDVETVYTRRQIVTKLAKKVDQKASAPTVPAAGTQPKTDAAKTDAAKTGAAQPASKTTEKPAETKKQ